MNGPRLATLGALAGALLACRGPKYPSSSIAIHCTDETNDCTEKMRRACPSGYSTLKVQRVRVHDVGIYGRVVLHVTHIIDCKAEQPAAPSPSDGDAIPVRLVIRRDQVLFSDQIASMGADDRLRTIDPLYQYLLGRPKDRAYRLAVDADAARKDLLNVLYTASYAGYSTAEVDFAGRTMRLHVQPAKRAVWLADWPAETLMAVVRRDAVELWRIPGSNAGLAPRRLRALWANEVHKGGAPAVERECAPAAPPCSPAVLALEPGATYAAASTVLDGLANVAAAGGAVADVLVHTAPVGYIRDAWRQAVPSVPDDGSSFDAALLPARSFRSVAERTTASEPPGGDDHALPTSFRIRWDLTDAADNAYDVALASGTPSEKQAVLRERALMWLALGEIVEARGPDAWVDAWGERPRVRARRLLERCIGFGEDKDCEALLQKLPAGR